MSYQTSYSKVGPWKGTGEGMGRKKKMEMMEKERRWIQKEKIGKEEMKH